MHRSSEGVFEKGSHVLVYWLANSEGFTLSQRPVKRRVTGVVIDPATGQAHSLVVGRSQVSADAVTAVDVRKRTLYLSRRRRERAPRDYAWLTAARRQAAAAGMAIARLTGAGARRSAIFAAHWARVGATATDARLRPLASAYAHNAAAIAGAYARAARGGWVAARDRTLER